MPQMNPSFRRKGFPLKIWVYPLVFLALIISLTYSPLVPASADSARDAQYAPKAQQGEGEGIRWFRDEMKISPKYVERQEGVLGMSYAHFFTMVFLFLFAGGAFIVFILRYKRTKEILATLREREDGSKH